MKLAAYIAWISWAIVLLSLLISTLYYESLTTEEVIMHTMVAFFLLGIAYVCTRIRREAEYNKVLQKTMERRRDG